MFQYAPLPYRLPANYVPSYYGVSVDNLPATMSAKFAAKGWNQDSNVGASSLPVSPVTTIDLDDSETPEEFEERLICVHEQMMFVSGEIAEASPETTGMIEEIVRAQVIEMVSLHLFALNLREHSGAFPP